MHFKTDLAQQLLNFRCLDGYSKIDKTKQRIKENYQNSLLGL